ncbi:MAG: hypothetical protein ABIQ31_21905 [Ferruginibacter sp.]
MRHQTYNGMGVDVADINNDAKPNIMVLDMLPQNNERRKTMIARADNENFALRQKAGYVDEYMRNMLQLSQGANAAGTTFFSGIAQLSGMNATDWSWSVLLSGFDNDGWRDSYVTNGFAKNITDLYFLSYNADNNPFGTVPDKVKSTREMLGKLKGIHVSNYIFRNNGHLEDVTEKWGLKNAFYSNGAAYADLVVEGNSHSTEVVYGWIDASLRLLLKGDGKGNFIPVPAQKSGLFLSGDLKGLAMTYDKDLYSIVPGYSSQVRLLN